MKLSDNKKYTTIAGYCILVFAVCLLLVIVLFRFSGLVAILDDIVAILGPVIWGIVLAYLLNPVMMFFEKNLKRVLERKKPHPKLTRYISITVTAIVTLVVLASLIAFVLPQIIENLTSIFNINNMQTYFNNVNTWFNNLLENNPDIKSFFNEEFQTLRQYLTDFATNLQPQLQDMLTSLTAGVFSFAVGIKDFFLGFIVMIYLLASKEMFKAQIKKVLYAFFPQKVCNNVLDVWHRADTTFISFISGKVLDSFIIGMLCFIAMTLMKMPYIVLISFIIGISNLIPFFGPIIGAIPSALLVLLSAPDKTVAFVVFIIILQQFDGNILGPKILGDSTGLPSFWVLFAIFIGGGFFGVVGMLLCIPVFAVIYMLVREFVEARLQKKALPVDTEDYKDSGALNDPPKKQTTPPAEE